MQTTTHTTIIRLPEVEKRTGYKRSAIYEKVRNKEFPAPIKLGERASGWVADQVEAWIQKRIQASTGTGPAHSHQGAPGAQ